MGAMGVELHRAEDLVVTTRPHARVLFWPIVALLVISAATGVGLALLPAEWGRVGQLGLGLLAVLLLVVAVVRPVLRWATTSTTLTTGRLVARSGLLRRTSHAIPLSRIVEVGYTRNAGDWGFGSGTLLLTTITGSRFKLDNLPRIKAMHEATSELVAEAGPEPIEEDERWS